MLLAGGQWLKVEGRRPDKNGQPYLYLFNHESLMDAFMLGGSIKHYITAVGAEYQFSYPIWGTLARRHGAIPIKRDKLTKAIYSLDKAEEAIRKGISFIISPEGTRTLSGQLGEFKKGPFHVALNTGVTIVPVALMGAYEAKKKTDWRLSPGILTIRFGEPITANQYKSLDIDTLRAHLREKIQQLIDNKSEGIK
jgi:1-acyl-sn-glycerol-3-phosphate acyltransferase